LGDQLYIVDQRQASPKVLRLSGVQQELCQFCVKPRSVQEIHESFPELSLEQRDRLLAHLVEIKVMLPWATDRDEKYLFLPVPVSTEWLYYRALLPLIGAQEC
jgi:hypothetical protein